GRTRTRYYISLDVDDRPGVLAAVAAVFAERGVSIETVRQRVHGPDDAELMVVTHTATDDALAATVAGLRELSTVRDVLSVMRVEGE
ncbi:MAG TPA: ACT domain-containing protein, partial [Jiangellaceae bacterium]|nr:ACT domain-containing protein [Jiangellaceae bacterium]